MTVSRLITDADVLAGRVVGPIVLTPGTLLTPAARDRASLLGIAIVEPCTGGCAGGCSGGCDTTGGCSCGGSSARTPPSCERCGGPLARPQTVGTAPRSVAPSGSAESLPAKGDVAPGVSALGDGLYLVRVVDGRTTSVHRATDS